MQLKTKKVIAREGLIIFGLILFSGLFTYFRTLPYWKNPKIVIESEVPAEAFVINGSKYFPVDKSYIVKIVATNDKFKITGKGVDAPTEAEVWKILEPEIQEKILKYTGIGISVTPIVYLFYWIIRFSFWAVKTLRQPEPEK